MTTTARESQILLDSITHISAVPERHVARSRVVIVRCEITSRGSHTSPEVRREDGSYGRDHR